VSGEPTFPPEALAAVKREFELAHQLNSAARGTKNARAKQVAYQGKAEAVLRTILACPGAVRLQPHGNRTVLVSVQGCSRRIHIPRGQLKHAIMKGSGLGLTKRGVILERLQKCGVLEYVLDPEQDSSHRTRNRR